MVRTSKHFLDQASHHNIKNGEKEWRETSAHTPLGQAQVALHIII